MEKVHSPKCKKRLDYSHFHKTGEKEFKNRDILKMSVTIDCELKLVCKINRFLDEYQVSLFSDVDEIDESLAQMRELQQEYEDMHIELRRELGDEEYEKTYTEFQNSREVMMTWLTEAKKEKKTKEVQTKFFD